MHGPAVMNSVPIVVATAILALAPDLYAQPTDAPPVVAPPVVAPPVVAPPVVAPPVVEAPTVVEPVTVEPAAIATPVAEKMVEEEKVGLVVTGSFFTRYELREGYDKVGRAHARFRESDFMRYRARFGLATTPVDIGNGKHVTLTFEPQASGFWADKGGTLSDGALGIHQAKMRLTHGDCWVDAGRFEMAYGEHLVIGTVGWHETARTFDGIRRHQKLEKGWFDFFFTQVAENPLDVKPTGSGDVYFTGIYAGLGEMIGEGMDLDAYLLSHVYPKVNVDTELGVQLTAGSRFKKKLGSVDVRAEGGLQLGVGSLDQLAFQLDTEVGTNISGTRVAGGVWFASGDDASTAKNEGWDQLYPTAHKFLGFADIIGGRSNIMGGMARVRHKLDSVALGADAHLFLRPQTPDGVDAFTGIEVDTFALKSIGKGLGLRGGYSIFVPNETGPHGTSDLAHYVEIQLAYALK